MAGTRSPVRAVAALCVAVVIAAVTVLVVGAPDVGRALGFLGAGDGQLGSLNGAAAFGGLLCWALVVSLACAALMPMMPGRRRITARLRETRAAVLAVLFAVALLVTALLQHRAPDTLCCPEPAAQMQEVTQLAR